MTNFAAPSSREESIDDLRELLQEHLDHPVGEPKWEKLMRIKLDFDDSQEVLLNKLAAGEIDKDAYFHQFTMILRTYMRETSGVLGPKDFEAVFGEAGYAPELIVDKEIYFGSSQ